MSKRLFTIVITLILGTVPVKLYSQEQSSVPNKIEREIEMQTFVPKGQWIVGSTLSFSVTNNDKYNFLFLESVDGRTHSFKASPVVCYAFADNQAAGVRGAYTRSFMKIDSLAFALDDDFSGSLEDVHMLKHSYSAALVYRYYINVGNSKRFGILTEMQLEMGGGQSRMINGRGEDVTGTYQESTNFGISFVPGLVAFINDFTAAEVTVGVLGFNHSKTKQVTNQVYDGEYSYTNGNFRINIFSISLGLAFYL